MSKKSFFLGALLISLALLTSACTPPWKKPDVPPSLVPSGDNGDVNLDDQATDENSDFKAGQMKKFNSYEELSQFLAEHSNPDSGLDFSLGVVGSFNGMERMMMPSVMSESSAISSDALTNSSGPNNSLDYSNTNNQVAGVDEADIIKTNGQFIYALVRNELSIIKVSPLSEMSVISKITFESRPQDIFIKDNYLAVFGADDQIYSQAIYRSFRRQNPYAFFKVFDLSDATKPKLVRDLDFEGSYSDARLIGDYVYFITNTYGDYVAQEPLVPRLLENGQVLPYKCDGVAKCFAPEVFYFDIPYDYYNFTNITAINITNNAEAVSGQIYLLNDGQDVYVSQKNIYITYTQYLSEYDVEQTVKREIIFPKLSAEEQDRISKIEAADSFILNKNEKKYKIAQVLDRYFISLTVSEQDALQVEIDTGLKAKLVEKQKEMEQTVIHKIGIDGSKIEYKAVGQVNGQVLNQFSMDEYGDYFRLATTRSRIWSRFSDLSQDSYSNIYVLDKNLKLVGQSQELGSSEKIYAARFMGDRVYLVTFRQTDPLYVIGLSDPTKPTVLGSIKIPGFSNYLHPIDQNGTKLLGLGRSATERSDGGVDIEGIKLSLFDFSDLSAPKELDSYLIGDSHSSSIALSDHKAFLYSEDKNLISFPAALHDGSGRLNFAGSLVFSVEGDKLSLKGRIDHSAGGHFTQSDYWRGFSYYDNTVKRSLYIGDNLFTFSNKYLKVNDLSDLAEVGSLQLTAGGDDYIITNPTPMESQPMAADGESGSGSAPDSIGTSTPPAAPDTPLEIVNPNSELPSSDLPGPDDSGI
jgi:uncharacterized secreted protein with C-terminal beta-propeller domain